jgi:hypothetical protein
MRELLTDTEAQRVDAVEREAHVLASVLLRPGAYVPALCAEGLEAGHFLDPAHGRLWRAILAAHAEGATGDALVIELPPDVRMDAARVQDFATYADPVKHGRAVIEAAERRTLAAGAGRVLAELVDGVRSLDDAREALAELARTSGTATAANRLSRSAPLLSDIYAAGDLFRDFGRPLLRLSDLPELPDRTPGIGPALDRLLGGLHEGYLLAVGAAHAGAGKTAFVAQLADAFALRTAKLAHAGPVDAEPLTPVLWLSEMDARSLLWRSLARLTGIDSRKFREGAQADGFALMRERAEEALAGEFGQSRRFTRIVTDVPAAGRNLVRHVAYLVSTWRAELAAAHGRPVWPVVVIDPIQRWQDRTNTEVESLNELCEALGVAARRDGWICLVTSDTNATAARAMKPGGGDEDARALASVAIRGSYKLVHIMDAVLTLEADGKGGMVALVAKNRWGTVPSRDDSPRWTWDPPQGRFKGDTARRLT